MRVYFALGILIITLAPNLSCSPLELTVGESRIANYYSSGPCRGDAYDSLSIVATDLKFDVAYGADHSGYAATNRKMVVAASKIHWVEFDSSSGPGGATLRQYSPTTNLVTDIHPGLQVVQDITTDSNNLFYTSYQFGAPAASYLYKVDANTNIGTTLLFPPGNSISGITMTAPLSIIWSGAFLYIGSYNSRYIHKTSDDGVTTQTNLDWGAPIAPYSMVKSGNSLYFTDALSGQLFEMNHTTGAVVTTFTGSAAGHGLFLNSGILYWFVNDSPGGIYSADITGNTAQIMASAERPSGLLVDGNYLYYALKRGTNDYPHNRIIRTDLNTMESISYQWEGSCEDSYFGDVESIVMLNGDLYIMLSEGSSGSLARLNL